MRTSLLLLLAFTSWVISAQPKTPFQKETGHNTAACSNDNTQWYCPWGGFPIGAGPWVGGWADNRRAILTRVIHPGVGDYANAQGYFGNIAKERGAPPWPDAAHPGDIHNLLYPGNTTKVFAVVQHWFSTCPLAAPQVVWDPPLVDSACAGVQQVVDVGKGYAGQKVIGYSVNDCQYIDAMVDDLWERGFDGIIGFAAEGSFTCATVPLSSGEYHGQPDNFTASCGSTSAMWWVDHGLQKLQKSMLRYPAMQYAMMFAGGFTNKVTCGCRKEDCTYIDLTSDLADPPSDYYQPQCIRDQIFAQLTYYAKGSKDVPEPCTSGPEQPAPGYFQRPNYLTPAPKRPVVQLFFDAPALLGQCNRHPCTIDAAAKRTCKSQADCWKQIWSDVASYAARELDVQPTFINKGSSTPDGAYTWTHPLRYYPPGTHGTTTGESIRAQLDWGQADVDADYAKWAMATPGAQPLYFGAAWKGVDDRFWNNQSTIEQGLVTSQRCGQTWLETFAEPGKYFSPTKQQLPYMIVPTYDDHEAGTAFQNGIDNCAVVSASLDGTKLTWSTTFNDPYGSPKTLDHYRLLDSPDGKELMVLADGIQPTLTGSLDVSALPVPPGAHVLYLKLVGKPGLLNRISAPLPASTLSLTKIGRGIVESSVAAMACAASCSEKAALIGNGTDVTLAARAADGARFVGWSGGCSGSAPTCTVTLTAAQTVTATFR